MTEARLLVPRLVVRTEYSTAVPFGAICGSETAFTDSKLSMVSGACCALVAALLRIVLRGERSGREGSRGKREHMTDYCRHSVVLSMIGHVTLIDRHEHRSIPSYD